jgi:hypothetical protein
MPIKGQLYPADPPIVEEIVAVMRHAAGHGRERATPTRGIRASRRRPPLPLRMSSEPPPRSRRSAVPVLFAGLEQDAVTGADDLDRASTALAEADAPVT